MTNAALTAQALKGAFYPTTYEHWTTRSMLHLTASTSGANILERGPPRSVTGIVIQAGLSRSTARKPMLIPLAEHEVRNFLEEFRLEERHFNYRYATFGG